MEVIIDKAWFEKNQAKFLKAGDKQNEEWGEGDPMYLIDVGDLKFDEIAIQDEGSTIRLMGCLPPAGEENIWFAMDIPLDTDLQLELVQAILKKMNKMKAVLEGLK